MKMPSEACRASRSQAVLMPRFTFPVRDGPREPTRVTRGIHLKNARRAEPADIFLT